LPSLKCSNADTQYCQKQHIFRFHVCNPKPTLQFLHGVVTCENTLWKKTEPVMSTALAQPQALTRSNAPLSHLCPDYQSPCHRLETVIVADVSAQTIYLTWRIGCPSSPAAFPAQPYKLWVIIGTVHYESLIKEQSNAGFNDLVGSTSVITGQSS
jgi:hypothetical protein